MRILLIDDVIARQGQVGIKVEPAITHFRTPLPPSYLGFKAASGPVIFNSVLVEVVEESGKAVAITCMDEKVEI